VSEQSARDFHELAAAAAQKAVEKLERSPDAEDAAVAAAYAQLSLAYSSLAWSPVFTPEIAGLD